MLITEETVLESNSMSFDAIEEEQKQEKGTYQVSPDKPHRAREEGIKYQMNGGFFARARFSCHVFSELKNMQRFQTHCSQICLKTAEVASKYMLTSK